MCVCGIHHGVGENTVVDRAHWNDSEWIRPLGQGQSTGRIGAVQFGSVPFPAKLGAAETAALDFTHSTPSGLPTLSPLRITTFSISLHSLTDGMRDSGS